MNKTFDRYASFIFFIIGAAFLTGSLNITASAYGSSVGPNIFPMFLGIILSLLSIKLFFETLRYPEEKKEQVQLDYKRFGIILVAAIIYGLTIEVVGYVIGTFLFLLIGFQAMQKGGIVKSIVISAVFSVVVYYLFVVVLKGTLPGFPVWFGG